MFTNEEDGEEELSGDNIQLNIQEACQESFLRSAARYQKTLNCTGPHLLLTR